jgi:asparagine N-glycosylation enzyme membrane subunit Stt3
MALEILGFFTWDVFLYYCEKRWLENKSMALFLSGIFGTGLGFASLFFFPHPMIESSGLRIANLFLSPLFSGLIAFIIARHFHQKRQSDITMHVIAAVVFVGLLAVIRFAYASHI